MLPSYLKPFASIKVTVILLVIIAFAMVYGTFYESIAGTPLAQADVYHSIWFDVLLGMLAINLFACTINRYPYRPHQIGWLMTHAGILVILAGAVISRNYGIEGTLLLQEGQSSSQLEMNAHQLEVYFSDGTNGILPLNLESLPRREGMEPKVVTLPNGKGTVSLIRFLPNAEGHSETFDDPNGTVSLHLKFQAPMSAIDEWIWAGDPRYAHWQIPMAATLHLIAQDGAEPDFKAAHLHEGEWTLIATPTKMALRRVINNEEKIDTLVLNQPLQLTSGTALTVLERKNNTTVKESYTSLPPGKNGVKALQFSVNANGKTVGPFWIANRGQVDPGLGTILFRMTSQVYDLGFTISLKDFRRDFYPGTMQAASFSSDVLVTDQQKGTFPFHIYMNNPLVHNGWKFFQSSFIDGTPEVSIFSVGYDPGTTTVYTGSVILILGLIGIFYFKSYLKRKFPPPAKSSDSE